MIPQYAEYLTHSFSTVVWGGGEKMERDTEGAEEEEVRVSNSRCHPVVCAWILLAPLGVHEGVYERGGSLQHEFQSSLDFSPPSLRVFAYFMYDLDTPTLPKAPMKNCLIGMVDVRLASICGRSDKT